MLFPFRPDSSTTSQGDENNNHNPANNRTSPTASPNNNQRYSPTVRFESAIPDNGKTSRKISQSTKSTKKRSLLQDVPTKYFSAKKTIMLNFLNGNEQKKNRKNEEEETMMDVDEFPKSENQDPSKAKSEEESNSKNQYSVLQVRVKTKQWRTVSFRCSRQNLFLGSFLSLGILKKKAV